MRQGSWHPLWLWGWVGPWGCRLRGASSSIAPRGCEAGWAPGAADCELFAAELAKLLSVAGVGETLLSPDAPSDLCESLVRPLSEQLQNLLGDLSEPCWSTLRALSESSQSPFGGNERSLQGCPWKP